MGLRRFGSTTTNTKLIHTKAERKIYEAIQAIRRYMYKLFDTSKTYTKLHEAKKNYTMLLEAIQIYTLLYEAIFNHSE